MTPVEALDPYRAADALPFRTVMLSISSGLMLLGPPRNACPPPPLGVAELMAVVLMGIPSTTQRGWLLPEMEAIPRRVTLLDPATPLEVLLASRPATLPERAFSRLTALISFTLLPATFSTRYPRFFTFLLIFKAVTTTSFSWVLFTFSLIRRELLFRWLTT